MCGVHQCSFLSYIKSQLLLCCGLHIHVMMCIVYQQIIIVKFITLFLVTFMCVRGTVSGTCIFRPIVLCYDMNNTLFTNNLFIKIMFMTALNAILVPSFVACGIIVSELREPIGPIVMYGVWLFFKGLHKIIFCVSPNSIFLCRGAMISEIREFNQKTREFTPFSLSKIKHFLTRHSFWLYVSTSDVRS